MNTSRLQVVRRLSRRHFLEATGRTLALGAGALALRPMAPAWAAPGTSAKTVFGSNVYGWTQYYQREKKAFNLDEVISALADCGYDYLENFMDAGNPDANAKFAEKLRAKGLRPVSLYTGGTFHDAAKAKQTVANLLKACATCQKAGFEVISCNPQPIGREKTDDELKTQAAALIDFGQGLKDLGLKLGIHHHLPELKNNAREFHHVFRNTPPETVGFCYDVHWVFKGGIQPMDALKDYGNRIVTWHLRQSRASVWWETLDTGDVDYEAVARYAREQNLPRRFTVELALEKGTAITRSAVENHRLSLEYARKVFGV